MIQPDRTTTKTAALTVLYFGTLITASILFILLATDFLYGKNPTALSLELSLCALVYLAIVGYVLYRKAYFITTILMLLLYFAIATASALIWSINVPVSVLMFGFVIVSSGFLLGSRAIFPVTLTVIVTIFFLQALAPLINISVSRWERTPSSPADAIGYVTFYSIYALTAWLYSRKMEYSLQEALQAQAALAIQRRRLARELATQSQTLQDVRIDEMRQLYRFAELGQLTVISLHDLANQISVLALDIDSTSQHSHSIEQTKQSITAVESLIAQARSYVDGVHRETFNAVATATKTINSLTYRARRSNVQLVLRKSTHRSSFELFADPTRFTQVISILILNAIEASKTVHTLPRNKVHVKIQLEPYAMKIIVSDNGTPIPSAQRQRLFHLQKSDKKNGNGIGLFIAKTVVESHFHGKLSFEDSLDTKHFIIELPSPAADPETFYKKT